MSQPLTLRTDAGDEHLDLADFEARVRRGEVSPQSLVRLPAVTGDDFVPAAELLLYRSLLEPRRASFARMFSLARFPFLTVAVLLVNLAVFLWTARGGPLDLDDMVRFGGKVEPLVRDLGQLWRLFTANFLHRDGLHIGLNLFVLFNVGGVLENGYRALDYLWLLVVSGLATMAASLVFSDAVSIGASGMVFGCLGGVVVFGLKYRSLLPSHYRRLLGEAAIPTLLGMLFIGLTSTGVDNAAHLGGLAAGMLTAAFLRPRLLLERATMFRPAVRAAPIAVLVVVVGFAPQLFGDALLGLRSQHDDEFGLTVSVPASWRQGADVMGSLAWYNGLPGVGRASFAAQAVHTPERDDVAQVAQRFADEVLTPAAMGGEVLKVTLGGTHPARVAERDALEVRATVDEPWGKTELRAYFVPKGELVYQLVFAWPKAYPQYAQVVDAMLDRVHLDETKALRQARAKMLLFPNQVEAWVNLGVELRRHGESGTAAEALAAAVRLEPSRVEYRVELARALLASGQVERACEASAAAVLYAPNAPEALEVDARCRVAQGDGTQALEELTRATALAPADASLRRARDRLERELERGGLGERP